MKLTWRNGVAYLFLIAAALSYVLAFPAVLQAWRTESPFEALGPASSRASVVLQWLVGPLDLVGWAAAVEYLSRIASALQKRSAA